MTEPSYEWKFESVITNPSGVRVEVTVTVPLSNAWPDVRETAEIAQMCANRAQSMVQESADKVPF